MNPTERFTNRVDHYVKYRPGYPDAALGVLAEALPVGCVVADVGSGTGISSRWLLQRASRVYGVEPNAAMRSAAVACDGFVSVDGTAEATGLDSASVDAVVCATAFHWFDVSAARREFARILRPGGAVILLWNIRRPGAYEDLIAEFATDYQTKWDHGSGSLVDELFGPGRYRAASVENAQLLDFDGLVGRAMSASYMPLPDDPHFEFLVARLRTLFDEMQEEGVMRFEYDTKIYWGVL
jgi:SAM-dependent methyltransferase